MNELMKSSSYIFRFFFHFHFVPMLRELSLLWSPEKVTRIPLNVQVFFFLSIIIVMLFKLCCKKIMMNEISST